MKPEEKVRTLNEGEVRASAPVRRSDVVEAQWEKGILWSALGVGALLVGIFFMKYGSGWGKFKDYAGVDLQFVCIPFFIAAPILFVMAGSRFMQGRKQTSFTAACPYCGHETVFVSEPMDDYRCDDCHRRVPVKDGRILDITGVRCGFCGALNFMSEKTKVLICEDCDREIPLLNPETGEMRHVAKGFARVDDDMKYELVLVAVGKDKEALINSLQHMLAMSRIQVKTMLENLPAVLLKGINRRKAEMLRAQIEANEGTAEFRAIGQ